MTLIEKTLKENTDKLLTKIALDYANNLITVPVIFERLEEELPTLLSQALQEQERDLTEKVRMDRLVLDELIAHYKEQDRESRRDTIETIRKDFGLWVGEVLTQDGLDEIVQDYAKQHNIDLKGSFAVWTPEIKEHANQVKEIIENREKHEN